MRRRGTAAGIALLVAALWLARRSERVRPIFALVSGAGLLPDGTRSSVQKRLLKSGYSLVNVFLRTVDLGFLNYGYAPIDEAAEALDLPGDSERDRYGIQLYDRIARARSLLGLDVLEVGCGRGGGASFLFDRHRPATLVGVDLSESSIAHCTERYGRPGLRFVVGDAEQLPFADGSFDVVLNVESSHCYPDVSRFLTEVVRVLRPGGVLLFADLRPTSADARELAAGVKDLGRLRDQIAASGLTLVEEEDITPNVLRALERDSERRRALIEATTPRFIRPQMSDFAGVEGSAVFRAFADGELTYVRLVLQRELATEHQTVA